LPTTSPRREFELLKWRLRDAILHDKRLTRAEQRIGYEIADHLNAMTGDAWPPQEHLAQRTGYSVKTIERATKRLAGTVYSEGLWFTREIDGRCYRYIPKFENLAEADTRQHVGGKHPTLTTRIPDISARNTRQNVGLSPLREPNRDPSRVRGSQSHPTSGAKEALRGSEGGPISFVDPDRAITARARTAGAPRFVYEGSEPWKAWVDYRERNGIPGALPTRQHMVNGRWRTGWDVPTLWPPGYGRVKDSG
jgi:Helix-turn-helix domain